MRESYYTLLTQVIQMGGGLFVFKILTSKLNSFDFGIYALILSFSALIFTFPFTAVQQALIKYSSTLSYRKAIEVYKTIFILDIVLFFVYFVISGICVFLNIIDIDKIKYVLILFYVITEVLKINNYMFLNSLRNRKKYFFSTLIEFLLKILILYNFVHFINEIFLVFILINIIVVIYSFPHNLNWQKVIINKFFLHWLRMIYIFASPLAIWGIFGWMRDMSNRWIIGYYLTLNDVALFAVINSLAVIIPGALQSFFGMYFLPILYRREKEKKGSIKQINKKIVFVGFFVIAIGTLLIEFLSEFIVIFLSDIKYINGSWMLAPIFFAFSLFSLSMATTMEIFAYNRTKLLLLPNIISGIISVVSFLFFVNLYGMKGAVYAFVISNLSYSILTLRVVYRFKYED